MKPSRSDEISSPEEEQRHAKEIQEYFESLAPKRPLKPCRSEPASPTHASPPNSAEWESDPIPEHLKLLELEAKSQALITEGGIVVDDTYEENEYYKELLAVDNGQHHTTGTGFIDISDVTRAAALNPLDDFATNAPVRSRPIKSNPATNDWIPAQPPSFISSTKPGRSDP